MVSETHGSTLGAFVENWGRYQALLREALLPLATEQLELRAAPHQRSIGRMVAHINATRAYWFGLFLGEGGKDLIEIGLSDEQEPPPGLDTLFEHMDRTWRLITDCLERWSLADMEVMFEREYGGNPESMPRKWVLYHVLEHDLHHGGEISLTLGVHGLVGIDP